MHIPPLDVTSEPLVIMHRAGPAQYSTEQYLVRTPSLSPDFSTFDKIIRNDLRSLRLGVQQVERLSTRLYKSYLMRLTDGSAVVLKCKPSCSTRCLRHEQKNLETEASILQNIAERIRINIPRVLKYDSQGTALGSPYILRSYLYGTTLADVFPMLSQKQRNHVDRSLGAYLRAISQIQASSFGPTQLALSGHGYRSWRQAFAAMIESLLRDAEDTLVSIPYDNIRYQLARHGHLLDQVTEARLVALDAGLPWNVIVDERTQQVAGLLGFENVVWGDPLMGSIFSNASDAFCEGYGQCMARAGPERIRQLLYSMYRATVAIVTFHFRPEADNDELEPRRVLTSALTELSAA